MKTLHFALIAIVSLVFVSCASKKETMIEKPDQPATRSYSQEQLKKTGQTQPGQALQKVDPSVQVDHH